MTLLGPVASLILPSSGQCIRWRKLEILLKFLGSYQSCYALITVFMFLSEEHIANVLTILIKNKLKSSTPTKHQVSINLDQAQESSTYFWKCMEKSIHEYWFLASHRNLLFLTKLTKYLLCRSSKTTTKIKIPKQTKQQYHQGTLSTII